VADGVVASVGANAVVLSHTIPNTNPVFSVYSNVVFSVPLTIGAIISKGAALGAVMLLTYTGNFPAFHPSGDHAHLHFEIRDFANATALGFPAVCNSQYGPAGVGYTPYPTLPDSYGYLDPLEFLRARVQANRVYLPVVASGATPVCQEGQDLAQNGGFETGAPDDAPPWAQLSTRYAWNAPLISDATAYQGQNGARLGGWADGVVTDEEMAQSFVVPSGTTSITWQSPAKLVPDNSATDPDDYFILTFSDAGTNKNLFLGGGMRLSVLPIPANTWVLLWVGVVYLDGFGGRKITLSYNAWNDESQPTLFIADGVQLITHCAANGPTGEQAGNSGDGLRWEMSVIPLEEYNAHK
jgi:hypothetical protein